MECRPANTRERGEETNGKDEGDSRNIRSGGKRRGRRKREERRGKIEESEEEEDKNRERERERERAEKGRGRFTSSVFADSATVLSYHACRVCCSTSRDSAASWLFRRSALVEIGPETPSQGSICGCLGTVHLPLYRTEPVGGGGGVGREEKSHADTNHAVS